MTPPVDFTLAVARATGADWADPVSLTEPDCEPRPYPVDALPIVIAEAVVEYQQYGQQPLPMVTCSALAAASLAAQGLADVQRDERLTSPTSLYFAVVAISGERKSSADKEFARPIREWAKERRQQLAPDIAEARAAHAAWKGEREGLVDRIKRASGKPNGVDVADLRHQASGEPSARDDGAFSCSAPSLEILAVP
jgi:hypothetical protein